MVVSWNGRNAMQGLTRPLQAFQGQTSKTQSAINRNKAVMGSLSTRTMYGLVSSHETTVAPGVFSVGPIDATRNNLNGIKQKNHTSKATIGSNLHIAVSNEGRSTTMVSSSSLARSFPYSSRKRTHQASSDVMVESSTSFLVGNVCHRQMSLAVGSSSCSVLPSASNPMLIEGTTVLPTSSLVFCVRDGLDMEDEDDEDGR